MTSFLLVVYFFSHKSINAGLITALSNRVGDCLILSSLAFTARYGSFHIFLRPGRGEARIIAFLLVLASTTKRAQIPFSAWLPAAMAAPTPVSSLVHSSTLVTAGVYLILRFNVFLERALPPYLLLIGSLTIVIAGSSALFEIDIKKIIALSTLSQLGLMIATMGLQLFKVSFFHLLTHAFFKALLFISVGRLIHIGAGYQDLRIIAFNFSAVHLSAGFSVVANLSILGFPFLRGFFSKDMILETVGVSSIGMAELALFALGTVLTATYRARVVLMVIWGPQRNEKIR